MVPNSVFGLCVNGGMKTPQELSNLLITSNGLLVLLADRDFEIMGVREAGGDLTFKVRT
jgi:hypothetical protein